MTITNLTFTPLEGAVIEAAAAKQLIKQRVAHDHAEAIKIIRELALSPPNLLRLALGLPLKSRGGSRPGGFEPGHQHNKRNTPSN